MIRKLFHRLFAPRHPWRQASLSEVTEVYLSHFLRTIAIGFSGIFIPVYLLGLGYSFSEVLLYYTLFFLFGIPLDFLAGWLVGRFGPKHIMRLAFLVQLASALLLIHIEKLPIAIPLLALIISIGARLYFIALNTDFSKVKHGEKSGKEIGWMQVMEKAGGISGPIIGGALATYIAPVATFWAASFAFLIATIILMLSPEPVRTRQKVSYKKILERKNWRNYASFSFMVSENSLTMWLWPVFLTVAVFTTNVYLKLGFVTSVATVVAMLLAEPVGKLIDGKKGPFVIKYATIVNSFIHLSRPFVGSLFGSIAVASANEPVTISYRVALLKGFYDSADDFPGHRIAYLTVNEAIGDVLRFITWFSLFALSFFFSPWAVCAVGFVLGALYSQGMRLQRYKALES